MQPVSSEDSACRPNSESESSEPGGVSQFSASHCIPAVAGPRLSSALMSLKAKWPRVAPTSGTVRRCLKTTTGTHTPTEGALSPLFASTVGRSTCNYGMPYYLQYGGVPCGGRDDQVVTYLTWSPTVPEPRLTFFLQQDLNAALLIARADDRVPAAERIRAALDLWAEDPAVRQRIDDHSREQTRAEGPKVKLTVSVSPERQHQLTLGRANDGVSATARIRAALNLWRSDAPLRARIDALAAERRRQRMASRTRSGAVAHP